MAEILLMHIFTPTIIHVSLLIFMNYKISVYHY
jgi:hypothetical protein